ncbi:zinc ribbon domain-containing protein [Succinimonas amylolytica]|uniref:zinc ribbon domain-containing protein n=1 Tax=Succinimonas amylolytica TaxID=83769 RepID=UPI0023A86C3F
MKCTQCGSEIPNGYEVCPRCKTIRARFCEKCGNSLGPRENFCSRCGAPRSGSQNEVRPELSPEEIRHTRELLQAFYAIETPLREQRRRILWGIGLQFVPLVNVFAGLPLIFYIMYQSKPLIDMTAAAFRKADSGYYQEKVTGVRTLINWLWALAIIILISFPVMIGLVVAVTINAGEGGEPSLIMNFGEIGMRLFFGLLSGGFALIAFLAIIRFFSAYGAMIEHIVRYRHILKSQGISPDAP